MRILSTCSRAILEVLFPSCCVACEKKLLQEEQIICSSCLSAIARTEHTTLPDNGIDMLFAEWMKNEHRTIHYVRGAAFAFYNRERGQILRSLIERGKFGITPNPHSVRSTTRTKWLLFSVTRQNTQRLILQPLRACLGHHRNTSSSVSSSITSHLSPTTPVLIL